MEEESIEVDVEPVAPEFIEIIARLETALQELDRRNNLLQFDHSPDVTATTLRDRIAFGLRHNVHSEQIQKKRELLLELAAGKLRSMMDFLSPDDYEEVVFWLTTLPNKRLASLLCRRVLGRIVAPEKLVPAKLAALDKLLSFEPAPKATPTAPASPESRF